MVRRAIPLFDKIIVGIGFNTNKSRYFDVETIKAKVEQCFKDEATVSVKAYDILTADFAAQENARYLLRGLRNTTDFEYENSIAQANRHINTNLETVFLITSPSLAYISSSIIRELHRFNQDVSAFLPYTV